MSWETLRQIKRENAEAEAAATERGPVACPIDGAVLEVNAAGVRNCPMGNYRWENGAGRVLDGPGVRSAF